MIEGPIKSDEKHQPAEYDTRDSEVPIVLHHLSSDLENAHPPKKSNRAQHYVTVACEWARSSLAFIWREALWNKMFWTVASTVVMAVATSIYAIYAGRQWKAMNDQLPELQKSAQAAKVAAETSQNSFNLTRRRAEDSDEARCSVRGDVEHDGNVEHISIVNSGKVTAHNLQAHIEISRNSLPTNKRLTLFDAFDVSQDELRIDTPFLKDIVLAEFGQKDWEAISQIREAIVVSGTMQYENGFDDVRHIVFCQAFLSQPANPGDYPQTPLNVLVDCDRLPTFLPPLYERLKKQAQQ